MGSQQQFVAAADMLVGARSADGGDGFPPDSLIRQFEADVDVACEPVATATIVDIATGIYLTGKAQYGP